MIMHLLLWLALSLLCGAQVADVTIFEVFDVHAASCEPHYDKLEIMWDETKEIIKDGNTNINYLINTPKVEPNSEWYQRQSSLMWQSMEQWRTHHPYVAMFVMHNMRIAFGTYTLRRILQRRRYASYGARSCGPELVSGRYTLG